jgi:hypothetical protein
MRPTAEGLLYVAFGSLRSVYPWIWREHDVELQSYSWPRESFPGGVMGFHVPPSLCVILVWIFFLPEMSASAGFATTLITAIPSRPIIFSKST